MTEPQVSIVLLTHNAGPDLDRVLDGVYAQEGPTFEVIAIDTASSDGTIERLSKRPVRLERIAKQEFSHPGTRNRGVRLARGEIVVFLVQDAIPVGERWLANLIAPLEDPQVGAAYSRQIPREGCNPVEARDIGIGAPPVRRVTRVVEPAEREEYRRRMGELIQFSNVASCGRRSLLLEHPFNEGILMIEDQEWCKRILEAGWTVVYEPSSVVMHSHDHTIKQIYERHRDYGLSFARFLPNRLRLRDALLQAATQSAGDYVYLWRQPESLGYKLKWAPQIPFRRLAMTLGIRRGLRS